MAAAIMLQPLLLAAAVAAASAAASRPNICFILSDGKPQPAPL